MKRCALMWLAVVAGATTAPGQVKIEDVLKAAGPPDAAALEKIKEYKKLLSDPDMRVRADQQERLSLADHPESAQLLVLNGLKDLFMIRDRAIWALSRHKSEGSIAVMRHYLKAGSEAMKTGCALALSRMETKPAGAAAEVAALLGGGGGDDQKIAFCHALGFFGDKVGTPALLPLLGGKDDLSVAAADALALIKDPESVPGLVKLLKARDWRSQVAAIQALGELRVKEAIGPLIEYLAAAEGRPREDAKNALQKITQKQYGMRHEDWEHWWKGAEAAFVVPPEKKEKDVEAEEKESRDGYGRSSKVTEYHRIKTYSKRMVFVLDISASMDELIRVRRGVQGTNARFNASKKIELARHELSTVLKTLDKDTWFNVMCFETDIRPWKKDPVQASPSSVAEAIQWFEGQRPRLGSGGYKASSGMDSNGMLMGRTNTYGALKWVFGRPVKPGAGVTGNPKPSGNCDTVFFLTDGEPTEGETTNIPEILADVAQWNKSARLTVHTIGMSETSGLRTLLQDLARLTGGKCVFVG
ncbi:MAG TPA: HEAT repeat domain-containing protein, partial [Planctomycetota bacterium]|nr:HEAT repeat domain-containing protein [Planctomycetota bacterium]